MADTAVKDDKKVVEEELVIGEKEVGAIADKVGESLLPKVEASFTEKIAESQKNILAEYLAKNDEVDKDKGAAVKAAEGDEDEEDEDPTDPVEAGIKAGTIDKEVAEMTPAMRFYLGMRALTADTPDTEMVKKISNYNIATQKRARLALKKQDQIAKAGYANETTAADGSVLIPDAEFVTTVYDNLPNYGVAFSDADVRQTDRTSVRVISLDSGLTFYATAEAGVKTGAKLAFAKNESTLAKYAVIVPATDELTDDAAIDYWNVVTRELTRAYARLVDELVFTNATSGITNTSGVLTHTYGTTAAGQLTWDDFLNAEAKTEDDLDESNFKWYLRKETWFTVVQTKGTTNDHYIAGSIAAWQPNPNSPSMPWGTPVKFTRVLPTVNSVSANDAIAVYGDLRNYIVYNKRGMAITMLTEGIVKDSEGTDFNLATQDGTAMRAVIRVLGILPKGNRTKFVVLGSGTVS